MMKLWHLQPRDEGYGKNGSWNPWYDKAFGFVIRADPEAEARQIAGGRCGDEGPKAWLDSAESRCDELTASGNAGVVLKDFHSA